jgi:hypothetical protein
MASMNRNAEATFRILPQDDQTYAIEVSVPDSSPTLVRSFSSEQAAEAWVAGFKSRVESGVSYGRRPFRARAK